MNYFFYAKNNFDIFILKKERLYDIFLYQIIVLLEKPNEY